MELPEEQIRATATPTSPRRAATVEKDMHSFRRALLGLDSKGSAIEGAPRVDHLHFWVAGSDLVPYKQNSQRNPLPVWPRRCSFRKPATITKRVILQHATTPRSLHVINGSDSKIWDLVLEIDYEQADRLRDATIVQRLEHYEASATFADLVAERAGIPDLFTEPSRRAEGCYGRFFFDPQGYSALIARGMIEVLTGWLAEKFPQRPYGPSLDKSSPIKGMPAIALDNPEYDSKLAERVEYIPWPSNPSDFDPAVIYGSATVRARYELAKKTYPRGSKWEDDLSLEPYITTLGPNAPAPCNYYRGAPIDTESIRKRFTDWQHWRETARCLTPEIILRVIGLSDWSGLEVAIEACKGTGRIDWTSVVDRVLKRNRVAAQVSKKKPKGDLAGVFAMVRSTDKKIVRMGVALLTLHMVSDPKSVGVERLLPIAEQLYEKYVPIKGSPDAERTAKLRCALRRALHSYQPRAISRSARLQVLLDQRLPGRALKDFNDFTGFVSDGTGKDWQKPRTKVSLPLLSNLLDSIMVVRASTGGGVPIERVHGLMASRGHTPSGTMIRAGMTLLAQLGLLKCTDAFYWFDPDGEGKGKARCWDSLVDERLFALKPIIIAYDSSERYRTPMSSKRGPSVAPPPHFFLRKFLFDTKCGLEASVAGTALAEKLYEWSEDEENVPLIPRPIEVLRLDGAE